MPTPEQTALEGHESWLRDLETGLHDLRRRVDESELARSVQVFMEWIRHARLTTCPLVSVIMPTHNRATLLLDAIASVQAQTYPNWELIVVDDASSDSTPAVLSAVDDARVRPLRLPRNSGAATARNAGLGTAHGELVTYLDDDNTMHPCWLNAVVWAMGQRPDIDVLYGAVLLDDLDRVEGRGLGGLPALFLRPYDRQALLADNLTDIGAIAHRAGLPDAHFDESLTEMADWDLLCTLTTHRTPLVLPAIACLYSSTAPNRLSYGPTHHTDHQTIRHKHLPTTTP